MRNLKEINYNRMVYFNPTFKIVDDSTNEQYELLSYIIDPRKEYIELYTKLDINTSIS